MGKVADPSPRKREKVEALLTLDTLSQREIAKFVNMSQKAIHTIKTRLDQGLTSSPKRAASGRKIIITPRARRILVKECRRNRKMTSKQLQGTLEQHDIRVSASLSVFEILDDKCQYVRRRPGEEFSPDCLIKTVKHPLSVMVWSIMSVSGVGRLNIVERKMNQHQYIDVLEQKMIPDMSNHFPNGGGIFQQDGAPCHTAKSVTAFMKKKNSITSVARQLTRHESN